MIYSMTAFARQESQHESGSFVWEVRSINHRYLECFVKIPENFNYLEPVLRDLLKQHISRGKIDIVLRYQAERNNVDILSINHDLLNQLINVNKRIGLKLGKHAVTDSMQLVTWPGIIEANNPDTMSLKAALIAAFQIALQDLVAMRKREGTALKQFLEQRLQVIRAELQKLKIQIPILLDNQRLRLQNKLAELKTTLDPLRLEQEIVLLTQKADIEEEISRLETHIIEVERCLQEGGLQGRRLDFLMQELNREANTIGSKAGDSQITSSAILLKVQIEQMREQVQNIE